MKSPYDVLGISPNSTLEEAKAAYRKLARKYHPDVSKEPDAEERFKEIQSAYDEIKNPQPKRHEFDFTHGPTGNSFEFFEDFVRRATGNGDFEYTYRRPRPKPTINLSLTLEECYRGTNKAVNGQAMRIPAGVRTGTRYQLPTGEIVVIQVLDHKKFQRRQDDLLVLVNISVSEAIMGTKVHVTHLDGKKYAVKVPPGVQHASVIKMAGMGLPNPQWKQKAGDLFIQFSVQIPDGSQLTKEQADAIMSLGYRTQINS